jgi:predicted ATPase with chaperone activity
MRGPAASGDEECSDSERARYYARLSRPLLDRIDILVEVPAVTFRDIISKTEGEASAAIRERVEVARTVADLAGEPAIRPVHVSEAVQYRSMDRFY